MSDPSKVARKKRMKTKYNCTDGNAEFEIEADSALEAAREYVAGGNWGEEDGTVWVEVRVTGPDGEVENVTIEVDPAEPECTHPGGHEWKSPYSVVGGIRDNPGVWGNGGGVIIRTVCRHCGAYCVDNTWAQNPNNGEQGLESTRYEESDEASLAWVKSQQEDAT